MTLAYGTRQPCDDAALRLRAARRTCPQRDKPWVLATAILGSSLVFIEGSAVNLALPALQRDFAATFTSVQWVANAYLLVLGSLMLIGGALGDRYGLRRIFVLGTVVFGIGALGCGLAQSMPMLIAMRSLQGLGGALLVPSSLALVSSHFDEDERGRAIGTWAGASALVTALGPMIGGWLVDRWGWPAVFFLVAPLAALAIVVAWTRVPRSPSSETKLDYLGALMLMATLALLVYALVDPTGTVHRRLLLLVFAVSAGAAFIFREARSRTPMLPLSLFRSRAFSGANMMTFLLYCALGGALYFLPFNLIQVQGYSALQAGAAFLPFTLIMGFGSTLAGDAIRTVSPRVLLTVGPLVAASGFLALAIPGVDAAYATGFLPGIALLGIGMTISVAPLTTLVMSSVRAGQAGVASGVNDTAARLAGVLAIAVLTAVAVPYFSAALGERLHEGAVPTELTQLLSADAAELAELDPPPGIAESTAAAIDDAIVAAYVATFRLLMAICGALAVASGMIAWIFLADAGVRT